MNVFKKSKLQNNYLPIPNLYEHIENLSKIIVIEYFVIEDKRYTISTIPKRNNQKGYFKFKNDNNYCYIKSFCEDKINGYLVIDNVEYLRFMIDTNTNNSISILLNENDKKTIEKKMLYYDEETTFYFRNINYEDISDKLSGVLNIKFEKIACNINSEKKDEILIKHLNDMEEKYGIIIHYGGGRSDNIPYIFDVKNKYNDIKQYSNKNMELMNFFENFIYH